MRRARSRKRSRTADQALARIDAILDRLEALMVQTETPNRMLQSKLARLEVPTLH